jgi:hypothetical protein
MKSEEMKSVLAKRTAKICRAAEIDPANKPSMDTIFRRFPTLSTKIRPKDVVILDSEENVVSKDPVLREAVMQFFREKHDKARNTTHPTGALMNLDNNEETMVDILRNGARNIIIVVKLPKTKVYMVVSGRNRTLELAMLYGWDVEIPVMVATADDEADALATVNAWNTSRRVLPIEKAEENVTILKNEGDDLREDAADYLHVRIHNPELVGKEPLTLFCGGVPKLTQKQQGDNPLQEGLFFFLKRTVDFLDGKKTLVAEDVTEWQIQAGMAVYNGMASYFKNIVAHAKMLAEEKLGAENDEATDLRQLKADVKSLDKLNDFVLGSQTLQALGAITRYSLYGKDKDGKGIRGSARTKPTPEAIDELSKKLAMACAKTLLLDKITARLKYTDIEAYIVGRMFDASRDAVKFIQNMNLENDMTKSKVKIIKVLRRDESIPVQPDWLETVEPLKAVA